MRLAHVERRLPKREVNLCFAGLGVELCSADHGRSARPWRWPDDGAPAKMGLKSCLVKAAAKAIGSIQQQEGPVTSVDESSKLVALKRARQRLELALAADADWQALGRCRVADEGGGEAERLEAKLLRNPLFRAWKNVNGAIEARTWRAPVAPGQGRIDRAQVAPEAEASVSFRARMPSQAPPGPLPQRGQVEGWPSSARFDVPAESREDAGRGGALARDPLPGAAAAPEAEVSVVSVDARRHAGAVERVLRALHGDKSAP